MQNYKQPDLDFDDQNELLDALRGYVTLQDKADKKEPDVDETTIQITSRDSHQLPTKVFRAASSNESVSNTGRALVVLFFGGGFVLGSPTSMAELARSLVKKFDAIVLAPTYRLAPEWPFPVAVNDGWDVLSWVAKNAIDTLQADPSKGFVVGGVSAGANLTNAITHLARDQGLTPSITGNWLSVAGVRIRPDAAGELPQKYRERLLSRTQDACVNSSVIGPPLRKLFETSLRADINSELYAPLIWPTESGHRRMPRTYSQVCGIDTAREYVISVPLKLRQMLINKFTVSY